MIRNYKLKGNDIVNAEGVAIYIHEATNAENRADRLAAIADALEVELSESYTAPEIYDTWKCCQYNQDRADRAEAKLRELIEAAEWRDECEETVVHSLTESVRYGTLECEIDTKKKRHNDLWRSIYLKVGKWRLAAEAAYQASIKAAKEVEG
jgi:hypothetical protein